VPNIAVVLKEEIRRLARNEIRANTKKLHDDNVALKHTITDLKRRLSELERKNKRLSKAAVAKGVVPDVAVKSGQDRARISAKAIRTLRSRLGLTQAELAQLLGVSAQSVYQWESKEGTLRLRSAPKAAVLEVREMGKKEARARLEKMGAAPSQGGRRGPRRSTKAKTKRKRKAGPARKAKAGRKRGRPRKTR